LTGTVFLVVVGLVPSLGLSKNFGHFQKVALLALAPSLSGVSKLDTPNKIG
jgi:hypothetical protein